MEDGILLVNKPVEWTSFKVVSFLKRKLGVKKIGHAGTLDPFATGLLIILIGKATKKFAYFQTMDKEYEATIHLGKVTDTYDVEGKIIKEYKGKIEIDKEKILAVLKSFEGEIEQTPPIFSALKIKGQPAYKLARRGEEFKVKLRKVFIKKIELLKIETPIIYIKVICSSGTYIRSLAYDIGQKLGYGAFLEKLKRTRIGEYNIKEAKKPEEMNLNNKSK